MIWGRAGTVDEACDDKNGIVADGCNAACEVEPGYVCAPNFLGDLSVCALPTKALVSFVATNVSVSEGSALQLAVSRVGGDAQVCARPP